MLWVFIQRIFINDLTSTNYIIQQTAPIETLQQGEWVPFDKAAGYDSANGWYDGEQTIEVSECLCGQDPSQTEKFCIVLNQRRATARSTGLLEQIEKAVLVVLKDFQPIQFALQFIGIRAIFSGLLE